MYRDALLAADSQIEALRARLARTEANLADVTRERERAQIELERIKEGVDPDPTLGEESDYRWTRRGLGALGALALIATAYAVLEVVSRWMPAARLDLAGLRNFLWSIQHGQGVMALSATGFVVVLCSPWVLLPWLGVRGLDRQRRWGWTLAVAGACIFLPTPALPVAALALVVLFSRRVRRVFFADGASPGA